VAIAKGLRLGRVVSRFSSRSFSNFYLDGRLRDWYEEQTARTRWPTRDGHVTRFSNVNEALVVGWAGEKVEDVVTEMIAKRKLLYATYLVYDFAI